MEKDQEPMPMPMPMPYPSAPAEVYQSPPSGNPQYTEHNIEVYTTQIEVEPGQLEVIYQYEAQPQFPTVMIQPQPRECAGQMKCPRCQKLVVTVITHKIGLLTWTITGVLCLFLLWPCCFIPFCVNSCKDVHHSCPECLTELHIYQRM